MIVLDRLRMRVLLLIFWVVLGLLAAGACSVTLTEETGGGLAPATIGPVPGESGPSPSAGPSMEHATRTPGAIAKPTAPAVVDSSSLELKGHLIYMRFGADGQELLDLDLGTGETSTLFAPEAGSWLVGAAASRRTGQILLAYAPAPEEGQTQTGFTGLSLLPLQGGESPEPWLAFVPEQETYASPHWSPEGEWVYFSQFIQDDTAPAGFRYQIARKGFPEGEIAVLADGAIWPRLSGRGDQLAYVSFDSAASENDLLVMDLNPSPTEARILQLPASFTVVDAPLFSPDGEWLYFSAPEPVPTVSRSWLDRLLGVEVARAHDVPSDWWRVPLTGGNPERLTELRATGLYGDFSPDGRYIAFISSLGLHVMAPDGEDLVTLISAPDLFGTLSWIP